MLRIRLLGPLTVATDGGPLAIVSKKARALLGFLVLREGIETSRTVLTGLLWGERSESQARASLRQTLSELRSALSPLPSLPFASTKEAITWSAGSTWIDAKAVEAAAGSSDDDALRDAAELLGGELMEGLVIGEAGFEQWLVAERERFRLLAAGIHLRLMHGAEQGGRLEEALTHGLKLLALDPLREDVHRTLMRLYSAQGRHDAALAQYEKCRRELANQLGVRPEPETDGLARSIRESRRSGSAQPRPSAPAREPDDLALSSKLSIAVLPFTNLSGDSEQQYFSDGITEDIITELSRYRSLLVIGRHSSFQFRDPSADIEAVRRKLKVRFIVEGSVRKIGRQLRLTAQLIDATTGTHVWAERYDREVESIFAVQDDLIRAVVATIEGRIAASGAEQAKRRPTREWMAYDHFLQGRQQYHRYNFIAAEPCFAHAIELDPDYAQAYSMRAHTLLGSYWQDMRPEKLELALEWARKALSLDDADALCHATLGFVLTHCGQRELAGPYFDRAVALNPIDALIASNHAWWLARMGRNGEALESLDLAMHRDPFPPAWSWEIRGIALLQERRYEDAIQALGRMNHFHVWDHAYIAACNAYLGRATEARVAASEVLKADPKFTVTRYARVEGYIAPADLKHLLDGMRKAGLPE